MYDENLISDRNARVGCGKETKIIGKYGLGERMIQEIVWQNSSQSTVQLR